MAKTRETNEEIDYDENEEKDDYEIQYDNKIENRRTQNTEDRRINEEVNDEINNYAIELNRDEILREQERNPPTPR